MKDSRWDKTTSLSKEIEEANPCQDCGSKHVAAAPASFRYWRGWVVACLDCGDVAEYDEPEDPPDPRGM